MYMKKHIVLDGVITYSLSERKAQKVVSVESFETCGVAWWSVVFAMVTTLTILTQIHA